MADYIADHVKADEPCGPATQGESPTPGKADIWSADCPAALFPSPQAGLLCEGAREGLYLQPSLWWKSSRGHDALSHGSPNKSRILQNMGEKPMVGKAVTELIILDY